MEAQEVPRLNLRLKDEKPVAGESIPAMTGTIRCDSKGNIYLRPSVSLMLLDNPVIKISPEGKVTAIYSLDIGPRILRSPALGIRSGSPRQVVHLGRKTRQKLGRNPHPRL